MALFNSLGSNYNPRYVLQALLGNNRQEYKTDLKTFLEEKYGGEVFLTYKGREALRLALRTINKPGEYAVGISGYTCYAVYDAVRKEGYKHYFLDITNDSLNYSFETLERTVTEHPDLKILIIQNTLGYPCDIERIAKFCKEKQIILIDDLAHSVGALYSNGEETGTLSDFIAFSFSQDKMIDGVSGGAFIVKSEKLKVKSLENILTNVPLSKQRVDRGYPLVTFLIRKMYDRGFGKGLHLLAKKLHLLSRPMDNLQNNDIYSLSPWYCRLIHQELNNLDSNLEHRRKIASIYAINLPKKILFTSITEHISFATNLRFPIFVTDRQGLISFLKTKKIYVSDIWYDAPIAPKKFMHLTDYNKQCPNAEKIADMMLNLPTHRNVSEKDAKYICRMINEWME